MTDPSITLLADAAKLLEMAARASNPEHAKLMRRLASELIANAHAEAELVDGATELMVA